jgi:hypothetical protein
MPEFVIPHWLYEQTRELQIPSAGRANGKLAREQDGVRYSGFLVRYSIFSQSPILIPPKKRRPVSGSPFFKKKPQS